MHEDSEESTLLIRCEHIWSAPEESFLGFFSTQPRIAGLHVLIDCDNLQSCCLRKLF